MSIEPDDRRATEIILEGGTPRDVARRMPTWFVRNHEGVICLWQTINRRPWRTNE